MKLRFFFVERGDRDHLAQCDSSLVSSPPSFFFFRRIKESFDGPSLGEKMVHLLVLSHGSKELVRSFGSF